MIVAYSVCVCVCVCVCVHCDLNGITISDRELQSACMHIMYMNVPNFLFLKIHHVVCDCHTVCMYVCMHSKL